MVTRVATLEAEVKELRNVVVMPSEPTPMTAISLFSGAGGDTLGLERAGIKVVAFNEFNEPATKTHKKVFSSSVEIVDPETKSSDIKKVPDTVFQTYRDRVNMIFGGFPCLVSGTLVLTNTGYMPIEAVSLDDRLMTHTGVFQPIVNLQQKVHTGSIFDIRIKYHPQIISATGEHPFYVRTRIRTWNNKRRAYEFSFDEPQWKTADKLIKDDFCGMPVNQLANIPTFEIDRKINKSCSEKISITLDQPDQWFMMGYFIGDGWIEESRKATGMLKHSIRFSIHNLDTVSKERIQRVLPITDKKCSTGMCDKYGCGDILWFHILQKFGKYVHGKIIPEWVQDAPVGLIRPFIDGYCAADGCKKTDVFLSYTTVSYNLAFGLQRLYLKLGLFASINKTIRPKTYIIQGRTVNQRDTYQIQVHTEYQKATHAIIMDNYGWFPIGSINERVVSEPIPVYNFEVATDNSYVVENTIVHNCQGFSHAGKKRSDDKRNELVHEFVRVTKIVQPEWIIGENVKGLLSRKGRLNPEAPLRPVIEIIQDLFEAIGYRITYQVIDVSTIGVPQNRKRLIIIGHRGTTYPHVPWNSLTEATTPSLTSIRSFLESHLEDAMELPALYKPQEQPTHYWIPTTETTTKGTPHKNLDRLVRGLRNLSSAEKEANPTLTNPIIEVEGLISFGVRKGGYHGMVINPDVPCNTIISTYNLCPRLFVGLHNPITNKYWIRCMTSKELGQIQGFPATYQWQGTEKEKIIQIGNAVPPPLAERIGRTILANRVELKEVAQASTETTESTGTTMTLADDDEDE